MYVCSITRIPTHLLNQITFAWFVFTIFNLECNGLLYTDEKDIWQKEDNT